MALAMAAPARAIPADFKAKADALLKAPIPADGPGAAVVVAEDGKIVYARRAWLRRRGEEADHAGHRVAQGSITSNSPAAVVLQLAAEGNCSS